MVNILRLRESRLPRQLKQTLERGMGERKEEWRGMNAVRAIGFVCGSNICGGGGEGEERVNTISGRRRVRAAVGRRRQRMLFGGKRGRLI